MSSDDAAFDVRIWSLRKYAGARGTTYTARWRVHGRDFQKTYGTRKLADSFRSELQIAANSGEAFSTESGLPRSMGTTTSKTWYQHACEFVDHKWPHASARHRKGIAEALTIVTAALVTDASSAPEPAVLRRALFRWAFNTQARRSELSDEDFLAIQWIESHSVPLLRLREPRTLRTALDAISVKLDGTPASASTLARKRSALFSALEYAVELEHLDVNPLDRLSWKPPASTDLVDRRVVVNPEQGRALLRAVLLIAPEVEGFFAGLYYAGLRPAEARNLRLSDCTLPETGWGELLLTGSHQVSGRAWTDSGRSGEERSLKHRSAKEIRRVPAHPELVETLHRHVAKFELGVDGHLFVVRTGKRGVPLSPPYQNPISMGMAYRVWHKAREQALSAQQFKSMLARRPYDLRHACLSTWLNAGVPATQVAEWAGHSVNVLLRVYAKCLDGQDEIAKKRIDSALHMES
ncbi:MAG TPA: tyrosine-type recombinase/integrase [Nocardioidaceae bacterium]|nr:tyrosine-type recombinase/integrase [Nocardioidaceae bacterium]